MGNIAAPNLLPSLDRFVDFMPGRLRDAYQTWALMQQLAWRHAA